ncbi:hypothetical protein Tco_1509756 [Tanacetum coccineum]
MEGQDILTRSIGNGTNNNVFKWKYFINAISQFRHSHVSIPFSTTYNGRSTFANPKYLKKAQSEKPRLYEIPYDTSDPANRFCPNGEETVTLEKEV